jgi:hypothetical protein
LPRGEGLLLHDALSLPLTEATTKAATTGGLTRLAKILVSLS